MPSLPFRLSFSLSASPFLFRPAFGLRFRFVSVSFLCLLGLLFRFCFRFRSQCIRKGKETTQAATRNETGPRGQAEAIWGDTGRGGRGGGYPSLCSFVWPTGGRPFVTLYIPSRYRGGYSFLPFLCSFSFLPGGLLVFLLSFPFRPACSSVFLVSFQERSSAWKW